MQLDTYDGVKKSGFSDVRKSNDAGLQAHGYSGRKKPPLKDNRARRHPLDLQRGLCEGRDKVRTSHHYSRH